MLARVQSYLLQGIDAQPCEVEINLDDTVEPEFAKTIIVGLPDQGVKEASERVRAALMNSGYSWPISRTIINLAPADVRKEGPTYDLPIAIAILATQNVIKPIRTEDERGLDFRKHFFGGELALDGRVRPIKGAIALASLAKARGALGVIVSSDNAQEAAVVQGINVYGVRTLSEVVGLLSGQIDPEPVAAPDVAALLKNAAAPIDFAEVRGQEGVKRAIVVAAAGSHNLLQLWPTVGHGRERNRPRPCLPLGHNLFELGPTGGHGGVLKGDNKVSQPVRKVRVAIPLGHGERLQPRSFVRPRNCCGRWVGFRFQRRDLAATKPNPVSKDHAEQSVGSACHQLEWIRRSG